MKTANIIVTIVAGLMLVIASLLKCYQLLTELIISTGFWESWEFFLIQIPLELGLGIWLLCGLFRKAAWLVAVGAFGMFIVITLQKGFAGAESCGCFGPIDVNPWVTLAAVDLTIFLGLLIFRPKAQKLLPPPWPSVKHFFAVAIPTFLFLPALVLILAFNKPPDKTDEYVVVKPEQWQVAQHRLGQVTQRKRPAEKPAEKISYPKSATEEIKEQPEQGQEPVEQPVAEEEWPMLQYIDIADSLRSGLVAVVFWRYDCPDCHEAIPVYDKFSRDMAGQEDSIRFAFIEVPPFGLAYKSPVPKNTPCLTGKLDSSMEWLNITTPFVVVILDSSLVKYWQAEAPEPEKILDAVFSDG